MNTWNDDNYVMHILIAILITFVLTGVVMELWGTDERVERLEILESAVDEAKEAVYSVGTDITDVKDATDVLGYKLDEIKESIELLENRIKDLETEVSNAVADAAE